LTGLDRRQAAIVAGVILLGAALRFATLDLQSYHHDEAVTAGRVILPNLFDTLDVAFSSERSPPLYYVLAWAWSQLFGTGEAGLRSLSALAGTLTIPAAYLAGRELAARAPSARRIGLFFAAFVAFNPYLIWYSQEARSYALLVLFATLGLCFFAASIREPAPRSLVLWAAASALTLLSHYFAIFIVAPQVLWLLWAHRTALRPVATAVLAVAAVGAGLLPLAAAQESRGERRNAFADTALSARVGEVGMNYVASEEPEPFQASRRIDAIQAGAAAVGAALLLAAIALVARRAPPPERRGAAIAGGLAAAAIGVPILLAAGGLDFVNPRNLILGLPALLALAAIGFGGERAGRLGAVLAGVTAASFLAVVVAVNFSSEMQRADWRGAAEAMGDAAETRVVVTNHSGSDPMGYYLGGEVFNNHHFPDGAEVREIEVLSTTFGIRPPPGFRQVGRIEGRAPIFFLTHLEADRTRTVRPDDLRDVIRERSNAVLDPG
jgi:4-amino-4-deoxy-L-arabinose transferase-like glycosyltransferase